MTKVTKEDIIKYRIARAFESLNEAKLLANESHWNTVANRLYYSCFYIVLALLTYKDITSSTHAGLKTQFFKHFIKTNLIEPEYGKLFSNLFEKRHEGDYQVMQYFDEESIKPLIHKTEEFLNRIKVLINL
jgi:uncharacterized protein (UPF0332 family)